MIICVCGMIASGKSTWCEKQGALISEYDIIGDKNEQIKFTVNMDNKGEDVFHITCFPTPKEREMFTDRNVKYVWINTSWEQCYENIFRRNRKRDIKNIECTLSSNEDIYEKYQHSNIQFEIIDVFPTEEKW